MSQNKQMQRVYSALLLLWAVPLSALPLARTGANQNFIQISEFIRYELGLASSVEDVYARFDGSGKRLNDVRQLSVDFLLGAAFRLAEDTAISFTLPFGYQSLRSDTRSKQLLLKEIEIDTRVTILRNLFFEQSHPTINLIAKFRLPTANPFNPSSERDLVFLSSPTPSLGIEIQKPVGSAIFGIELLYSKSFGSFSLGNQPWKKGDEFQLQEFVSFTAGQRLSFSLGSKQKVRFPFSRNGERLLDSGGHQINAFASASVVVHPRFALSSGVEYTLPIRSMASNSVATRRFSIATSYGFD